MNDPKYTPMVNGLWHNEGKYFVPPNEPIMTLRGKDVTSLVAVTAYVKALLDCSQTATVESHLNSSIERLAAIYKYQLDGIAPGVGCSQEYHNQSAVWILEAKKLLDYLRVEI